jgi:hypothetical protein
MTGQAEFQQRSTIDASALSHTMEHGLTSLKTDLCDSILSQMKQIVIDDDASVSASCPQSNLFENYSPVDQQVHPGQYYPAPYLHDDMDADTPADAHMGDTRPAPSCRPWYQDHGNPFTTAREHPFFMVATRNNNCSKFKMYLHDMVTLSDDSLVSLEHFVDSIKGDLQASLSSHKYVLAYAEWTHATDILSHLCPPSFWSILIMRI